MVYTIECIGLLKTGKFTIKISINGKIEHLICMLRTKKNIGKKFVDYLGPINFNAMPFELKKNIVNNVNKNNYEFKKKTTYCKLVIT